VCAVRNDDFRAVLAVVFVVSFGDENAGQLAGSTRWWLQRDCIHPTDAGEIVSKTSHHRKRSLCLLLAAAGMDRCRIKCTEIFSELGVVLHRTRPKREGSALDAVVHL